MTDRDDELAEAVDELARTLAQLQGELESRRRSRFRPPTPGELLRFSDEVAIPTLLAILEANVRALEAFQKGIKLVRTEREVRDRAGETAGTTRSRANDLRRTTLSQLDAALVELQRAVGDGTLPREQGASELIEEARDLRDEVDRRLRDAGDAIDEESTVQTIEIDDESTDAADDNDAATDVDVDAELETLRDQYAPDHEDDGSPDEDERTDSSSDDGTGADGGADRDEPDDSDENGR